MKKKIAILISLLVLLLGGCGEKEAEVYPEVQKTTSHYDLHKEILEMEATQMTDVELLEATELVFGELQYWYNEFERNGYYYKSEYDTFVEIYQKFSEITDETLSRETELDEKLAEELLSLSEETVKVSDEWVAKMQTPVALAMIYTNHIGWAASDCNRLFDKWYENKCENPDAFKLEYLELRSVLDNAMNMYNQYMDRVIYDPIERDTIQQILMSLFVNSDRVTYERARLFFGGKSGSPCYTGYSDTVCASELQEKYGSCIEDTDKKGLSAPDNNGIYTSIYVGRKNPLEYKTEEGYYNIKALTERDSEYLKEKLNMPHVVVTNNEEYMDYIRRIDLGVLLEMKYPRSFRCLFHDDHSSSASIFQTKEGYYMYHCFAEGKTWNIVNIVEKLGNFKSRPKAHKFIREIINVDIQETEWQKEQKEILDENMRTLLNEESLKKNYPHLYRVLGVKGILQALQFNQIAKDNVYSERLTTEEGLVAFFCSNAYLCKQLGASVDNRKRLSKRTSQIAYVGMLNKLDDKDIPEEMLKRSQAISIQQGCGNHINVYSVPSYTTSLLEQAEEWAIRWKQHGYTLEGCSREMFYRTEGKEVADKLYPQYKDVTVDGEVVERTTSPFSDGITMDIAETILEHVHLYGYSTEKLVIEALSQKYSRKLLEVQIRKCLAEILDSYSLQRVRLNKIRKQEMGIRIEGYPFIIINSEEECAWQAS